MATPWGDGGAPNKRFNAKYNCKWCNETWKTKNTSHLKMICKNPDCRKLVRAYKFEVINKLVVYKCETCGSMSKKAKCSSEVKEVPYCRICQKDMAVHVVKGKRRMFGEFVCNKCHHGWKSGYAWSGVGQKCRLCDVMILPRTLRPLQKSNPSSVKGPPHRQDLCEMCIKLGRSCKGYEDVAKIEEIPLEEDTQSVTTNSSVDGGDDQDEDDGSTSGGDHTPSNSDDELDDSDSIEVKEMMSKVVINQGKESDEQDGDLDQ